MVEHSTHNPKIKGLSLAAGKRERKWQKDMASFPQDNSKKVLEILLKLHVKLKIISETGNVIEVLEPLTHWSRDLGFGSGYWLAPGEKIREKVRVVYKNMYQFDLTQ